MNRTMLGVFLLFWVSIYFLFGGSYPYDDTDDSVNRERSGFMLYTDNLTGCQYLRAGLLGGTFPRLSKGGNHVGCK